MEAKRDHRVVVFGATCMLGRPVVRSLVSAGYRVRALVRDSTRARRTLPREVELAQGDLRDRDPVDAALAGADVAYLSLNTPFNRHAEFDPDRDGTSIIARRARERGVSRILRLSALGVPEGGNDWWAIARKTEADEVVLGSGLQATVFRCDWFMESLPLMVFGPLMLCFAAPPEGLYWTAGEDFGRQVAVAIEKETAIGKVYPVQGPEAVPMKDACRRFARSYSSRLLRIPVPPAFLRLSPLAQGRYGANVLRHTYRWTLGFRARETWAELGRPPTKIEDYAASIEKTGDFPRKPLW